MESSDLSDVFVSYRRKNVDFIKRLVAELKAAGKEVWVDWEDLPPGTSTFNDDIRRGLEGADAVICVLSPDYLDSAYCVEVELGYAVELNKKIIPIVLEKFPDERIPQNIADINWVYFVPHAGHENPFEESFAKVLQALEQDLDHARMHRRFALRAIQWEAHKKPNGYLLSGKELEDADTWINNAAGKVPEPTELHAEYITASRRISNMRQRRLLLGTVAALIVSIALTIASVFFYLDANQQRQFALEEEIQAKLITMSVAANYAFETDQLTSNTLGMQTVLAEKLPLPERARAAILIYSPAPVALYDFFDDHVSDIALNQAETRLLAAADDGSVVIWNLAENRADLTLVGHEGAVRSVAWIEGETQVASGGRDGLIRLWDATNGDLLQTLNAHAVVIHAEQFAAGSLTSVANDGQVTVWDLSTGEAQATYRIREGELVTSVAFSDDGRFALMGFDDTALLYWDVETEEVVHSLSGHEGQVDALDIAPAGDRAISGARDNLVIFWDLSTGEALHRRADHVNQIIAVTFDHTGRWAASGSWDSKIILWDSRTGDAFWNYSGHTNGVSAVAFSEDDGYIYSGAWDSRIIKWDTRFGQELLRFPQTRRLNGFYDGVVNADATLAIYAGANGQLTFWDATTGEQQATAQAAEGQGIWRLALSTDGSRLITLAQRGELTVWDVPSRTALGELIGHAERARAVALSPDGTKALSGNEVGTAILWDLARLEPLLILDTEQDEISALAFSNDGNTALIGDVEGRLALWDLTDGTLIREFVGHTDQINDIDFSSTGERFITGSADLKILMWDVASGAQLQQYEGHIGGVSSVLFNPTDEFIISGSWDTTITIWLAATGAEFFTLSAHQDSLINVGWDTTGRIFYSLSDDGIFYRWEYRTPQEFVAWAFQNRYFRDTTCQERQRYG
ncbi:MAG: TIR domain-containing protein, partial [Phototrophicaceae bacterium]